MKSKPAFPRKTRHKIPLHLFKLLLFVFLFLAATTTNIHSAKDSGTGTFSKGNSALEKVQIPFIANQGQIQNDHVRFFAKTFGGIALITVGGEIIYNFPQKDGGKAES